MRLLTKARIVSSIIFGIGAIGIGVREYNSYLVTKTVTVHELDRIYPVWGDPLSSTVIGTLFIVGLFAFAFFFLGAWLDSAFSK